MLAIEIDGDSHDKKQYLDKTRDTYLEQRGIKTVRYLNEKVLNNLQEIELNMVIVIEQRKQELNSISPFQGEI